MRATAEHQENKRVLVTGSTGFVGRRLVTELLARGYVVSCAQRKLQDKKEMQSGCDYFAVGDFTEQPSWDAALAGVDSIVHLAARVHVMQETAKDPLTEFRKANVDATLALAKAASAKNIRRFVYISTVKVNGEQTEGTAFTENDPVSPIDPYARSKFEAEQALLALGEETGMEIVIIRPVLVYGPGVKGNIFRLLQLIQRGIPLPFKGIDNHRSLLALDNLVDLIILSSHHPRAANQIFLAADGDDVSTDKLVRLCASNMHQQLRMFKVPGFILVTLAGMLAPVRKLEQRLYGSLQVDINQARTLLAWQPPKSLQQGIAETVEWYQASC